MARDLKGAIRLAKFKVDECRRAVSDLQGLEAEMLSRIEAFEAEFAREKAAAAALDGIAFTMEGYLDSVRTKRHGMEQQKLALQATLQVAQDQLSEAYKTLKTFEISQENREKREREEAARRDQAMLDEQGLTLFRRRGDGLLGLDEEPGG